jgi:hypothetical protein
MSIVTNTRRRPADDPSTALERNRAEDARLAQRINAAAAELHGYVKELRAILDRDTDRARFLLQGSSGDRPAAGREGACR